MACLLCQKTFEAKLATSPAEWICPKCVSEMFERRLRPEPTRHLLCRRAEEAPVEYADDDEDEWGDFDL